MSLSLLALLACTPKTAPVAAAKAPDLSGATEAPTLDLASSSFQLDNGLRVYVHEDRKAPLVAVSVWYDVGSRDEPVGKTGFAHLFEHLMFNGSENYDNEWFGALEEAGATALNGTTWLDRTNYFQTVPTPALDRVLWMESDRMGHLLGAISQDKLDEQRGVVQNEKRQGENQPYGVLNDELYAGLFPQGHPYHHSTIGSMEDLDAASLDDVKQWFEDYYGPNNALIVLAGDIDTETAREKMERFFGDIPAGPEVAKNTSWIPERSRNTTALLYDEVPAALVNRVWAVPGRTTREGVLLELVGEILGGGPNARVTVEVVNERQIATRSNTATTPFVLASVLDMTTFLKPGVDPAEGTRAMDEVIAKFLEEGPTTEELLRVKASMNADALRGLQQVGGFGGKAVAIAQGALYAGDPDFAQKRLDWINEATVHDVHQVAKKWMQTGYHQVDVVPAGTYSHAETGVDRAKGLPAIGEVPALQFPELQRATLSNGIELVFAQRENSGMVDLEVIFDAGYKSEVDVPLGTASFAVSMLEEGTESRSGLALKGAFEALGTRLYTGADLDSTSVGLSTLASNLGPSLTLLGEVLREPAYASDEIERIRKIRLARVQEEQARPNLLALRTLPPLLYGDDHPYGVPLTGSGTTDSVTSITRDQLLAYRGRWLGSDNATILAVGDTDLATLKAELERALAGWAKGDDRPAVELPAVALPSAERVLLLDKPGSPQTMIFGGLLIPSAASEQRVEHELMNEAFGGKFSARINMNLREDKSWAYGAYAFSNTARGQQPWLIYAPVQTDKSSESLAELRRELSEYVSTRPMTDKELNDAVINGTRTLPGRFETQRSLLSSMATQHTLGLPLDDAATLGERLSRAELAKVREAAKSVLKPASVTWVVVGDLATIEAPIRALGLPTERVER